MGAGSPLHLINQEKIMTKIIDNFLDPELHKWMCQGIVENTYFPWYFQPVTAPNPSPAPYGFAEGESQSSYNHLVYLNEWSDFHHYFKPLLEKIDTTQFSRVKINSVSKQPSPKIHGWHLDQAKEGESTEDLKVSVYYLNTNNGYTLLEDGTRVDSVANRLVTFSNTMLHTCVSQTDVERRFVVNINYY